MSKNLFICSMFCGILVACSTPDNSNSGGNSGAPELDGAVQVELWATRYYTYLAEASDDGDAIPIRDMEDKVIGPSIEPRDWCLAALEGSLIVSDSVYNYAGTRDPRQTECSFHRPTERVRWQLSNSEFGIGSKNNSLVPFRTIACDLGTVRNSSPWLNGSYPEFGQKIYIPDAVGVVLPDGSDHNGVFECADTGGLIVGNHIDVFIGAAKGTDDATEIDPFGFTKLGTEKTFTAYILAQ